jgi:hypothetical protein
MNIDQQARAAVESLRESVAHVEPGLPLRRPRSAGRMVAGAALAAALMTAGVVAIGARHRRQTVAVTSPRPGPSLVAPQSPTPSFAEPGVFPVPGYTPAQARRVVAQCVSWARGSVPADQQREATLRAAFADTAGSTLIITIPTAWSYCNLRPDGTIVGTSGMRTYAFEAGWGPTATAPDTPARWLAQPVELDDDGGGVTGQGWLGTATGRVSSAVTRVQIAMPGGSLVTAVPQNGFFAARQTLKSQPVSGGGAITIRGYDASGRVVYDAATTRTGPAIYCVVTPTGQPVSPPSPTPGEPCRIATPWP